MFPFTQIRKWLKSRKESKRLITLAKVFGTFRRLEQQGLISYTEKDRLFIAMPLAVVQIARGRESFERFLNNLSLYHYQKLLSLQWDSYVRRKQNEAVHAAMLRNRNLTPMQIQGIKRDVTVSLHREDITLPPLNGFEFFVVSESDINGSQHEVAFVGSYNPETRLFDMAEWREVRDSIKRESDGRQQED